MTSDNKTYKDVQNTINKEIQNYLYSLRFQFSFVIVIIVFLSGTISFIPSYKQASENLMKYQNEIPGSTGKDGKKCNISSNK